MLDSTSASTKCCEGQAFNDLSSTLTSAPVCDNWEEHDRVGAASRACEDEEGHRCCKCFLARFREGKYSSHWNANLSTIRIGASRYCVLCSLCLEALQCYKDKWDLSAVADTDVHLRARTPDRHDGPVNNPVAEQEGVIHLSIWSTPVTGPGLFLELSASSTDYSPIAGLRVRPKAPSRSSTSTCFPQIKQWISQCRLNHKDCLPNDDVEMPTRVLDVECSPPRLREANGARGSYLALSHCWGSNTEHGDSMPKTTKTSIYHYCTTGISSHNMTETFQDAVTIARALDFRYLWIDALCIIQDDQNDWAQESSRMAEIYGNAKVVLAAVHAQDGSEGCFPKAPYHHIGVGSTGKACAVVQTDPDWMHEVFYGLGMPANVDRPPLAKRAWCLQERLLAARCLHFSSTEIFFECESGVACECSPELYGGGMRLSRGSNLFRHLEVIPEEDRASAAYQSWTFVLKAYSTRSLTYSGDRLPALAGLARRYGNLNLGSYYAGIWSKTLPSALAWSRDTREPNSILRHRSRNYTAPTWSCLSLETTACNTLLDPWACTYCSVEQVNYSLVSGDAFGRVSDAFMVLHSRSRIMRLELAEQIGAVMPWEPVEAEFTLRDGEDEYKLTEDVCITDEAYDCYVPLGSDVLVVFLGELLGEQHQPSVWDHRGSCHFGLALRPSSRNDGSYERFGFVDQRSDYATDPLNFPERMFKIV